MSLCLVLAGVAGTGAAAQDGPGFRLLMIEQDGCPHCSLFNRDIAPIYDVSPEGRAAPLVRADLRGPLPDGVTLQSPPFATPTFILLGPDGRERDRLLGFPGEDFFWFAIAQMLADAGAALPGG